MTPLLARSGSDLVARAGRFSVLVQPRTWLVNLLLLGVVAALFVAAVTIGTTWLPLGDVVRGIVGAGDSATNLIVQRFRMPRAVVGVLVGAALAAAGALVQTVTRNPIATPDVIGVTAGASFGAVATLLAFGGATFGYGGAAAGLSAVGLPVGAIAGAFLAAVLVLGLATNRKHGGERFSTRRVVLAGIVLHSAFIGLVHWGLASGDVDEASKAQVWLVGTLHGRGWEHVAGVTLALAVLTPVVVLLGRRLLGLQLGETSATTLGVPVVRTQLLVFAVAFALTGTAVAAAGPVNFVALIAPQIARRIARRAAAPLISSALTGAALLLAADLAARLLVPGHELPAGSVTALVGAPYLLWLVVRSEGHR
ncbi:MAG: iron chelate uptake ABC transporter family permease subunit [Streptosporangiales bacterium]|nr:iron chelate uptake ABC transporter family permease subunit [Streptosporangiales bacterium]